MASTMRQRRRPWLRPFAVIVFTLAIAVCHWRLASAAPQVSDSSTPAPAATPADSAQPLAKTPPAELQQWITQLARRQIPRQFESDKKWGLTKEVVSGLSVRRVGLRIKTKRRRKQVNHGTWTRYRAEVVNPQEHLMIRLDNVEQSPDGPLQFDLDAEARLHLFGRLSKWERGVQLASLSADAQAKVRLRARCQLSLKLDPSKLPPDILLVPEVQNANLEVTEFRLNRLSDVGGPLAKRLGEGFHELLEEILEDKQSELTAKINRKLDQKQDELRLSLHDLAAFQWAEWSEKHLRPGDDNE